MRLESLGAVCSGGRHTDSKAWPTPRQDLLAGAAPWNTMMCNASMDFNCIQFYSNVPKAKTIFIAIFTLMSSK
jgi:hypothetical protein